MSNPASTPTNKYYPMPVDVSKRPKFPSPPASPSKNYKSPGIGALGGFIECLHSKPFNAQDPPKAKIIKFTTEHDTLENSNVAKVLENAEIGTFYPTLVMLL